MERRVREPSEEARRASELSSKLAPTLDQGGLACPTRGPSRDPSRSNYGRGAGRTGLVVLCALALAILAGAAWFAQRPTPAPRAGPSASQENDPREIVDAGAPTRPLDGAAEPRATDPVSARTDATPIPVAARFYLRIALQDESGAALDGVFRIRHARAKFAATQPEFVESTHPGPVVTIEVPNAEARRVSVTGDLAYGESIVAVASSADADPVAITLHAQRIVSGTIVDAEGNALENVRVFLVQTPDELHASRASERSSESVTDITGRFELACAVGSAARLLVGDANRPWIPAIEIAAKDRAVALDPITLELHAVTFLVRLADGMPASGAELIGTGLDGGRFERTTDVDGRVRVERMPRGRWRVIATSGEHGRQNRAVDVPLTGDEPVVLVLPR